jgi:dTDP-4-dehydrorhamnose reductase
MKICVLGGGGMLGHKMYEEIRRTHNDVWLSVHGTAGDNPAVVERFGTDSLITGFDVMEPARCTDRLRELRPDVIVNCIGVLKRHAHTQWDAIRAIAVNGLFPHHLSHAAEEWNGRVIHFSTDCVFRGDKGRYSEDDIPDATDLYGRSKTIGEPHAENTLVVRTSLIGPELAHKHSLLEWFLREARNGREIKGYRRAIFSGLTTLRLALLTGQLIRCFPKLAGVFHVSGETISKYDLLCLLRDAFRLQAAVCPDDSLVINRSLDSSKFRNATGIMPPQWRDMIAEL